MLGRVSKDLRFFPYLCGLNFVFFFAVVVPIVGYGVISSYYGYSWPRLCLPIHSISGENLERINAYLRRDHPKSQMVPQLALQCCLAAVHLAAPSKPSPSRLRVETAGVSTPRGCYTRGAVYYNCPLTASNRTPQHKYAAKKKYCQVTG